MGVDDVKVGRIATQHLIDVGCKRPAHIGGPDVSTSLRRLQGYREMLQANGFAEKDEYVIMREHYDDAGQDAGYTAMKRLLHLDLPPDGVFCFNDPTAVGVMKAALEAGLQVPKDVAIVGCGNVIYADFLRVPLTSVDQQSGGIGERAAELAVAVLQRRPPHAEQVLLEPSLVQRASTMR